MDGESGKTILAQLNAIAAQISSFSPPQITFTLDEPQTKERIQQQLNTIAQGLKITIGRVDTAAAQPQNNAGKLLSRNMPAYAQLQCAA